MDNLESFGGVNVGKLPPEALKKVISGKKVSIPHSTPESLGAIDSPGDEGTVLDFPAIKPKRDMVKNPHSTKVLDLSEELAHGRRIEIAEKFTEANIVDEDIMAALAIVHSRTSFRFLKSIMKQALGEHYAFYYRTYIVRDAQQLRDHPLQFAEMARVVLEEDSRQSDFSYPEVARVYIEAGMHLSQGFAEYFLNEKMSTKRMKDYLQVLFIGFVDDYVNPDNTSAQKSLISSKFMSFIQRIIEVRGSLVDLSTAGYKYFSIHVGVERDEYIELLKLFMKSSTFNNKYSKKQMLTHLTDMVAFNKNAIALVIGDSINDYIYGELGGYSDEELEIYIAVIRNKIQKGKVKVDTQGSLTQNPRTELFFALIEKYRRGDPLARDEVLRLYKQDPNLERYKPAELRKEI